MHLIPEWNKEVPAMIQSGKKKQSSSEGGCSDNPSNRTGDYGKG